MVKPNDDILLALQDVLESRKGADPSSSYVAKLYNSGLDSILKKIGEEATEVVMAAKDQEPAHITNEVADLLFHLMVLLSHQGLSIEDVNAVLASRFGLSGIDEKAARKNKD